MKDGLTLNHIEEIVSINRNFLSGAVIGLALSGTACHYGFVKFLGPNDSPPPDVLYDYSSHVIVRKSMSVEDATNLILQLKKHDEIINLLHEPIHFILSQGNNPIHRLGSKDADVIKHRRTKWPMLFLRSQISYKSPPKSVGVRYLSRANLPFFPKIDDAIMHLFDVTNIGYIGRGAFEIMIPDYRGRIVLVTIQKYDIEVNTECHLPEHSDIQCKIFVHSKERTFQMVEMIVNNRACFSLGETPHMMSILLTDSEDQELDYVTFDLRVQLPNWVVMKYSEEDIESLLDMGEGLKVEYKIDIPRGAHHKFLESVSAFANTEGGKILIGVDDNANVAGWRGNQNQRIRDIVSSLIEPEIRVSITDIDIDEKIITAVNVPEGTDKPYVLRDHGPYKRIGATDAKCSRLDLERMMEKRVVLDDLNEEDNYN